MPVRILQPPPRKQRTTNTDAEQKFYGSHRWRITSQLHRRAEPLCRECAKQGRVTAGTLTDHIIPISQGGEPWSDRNHQTLCDTCHNRKRKLESLQSVDSKGVGGRRKS